MKDTEHCLNFEATKYSIIV